jgi:hypothetical protein
MSAVNCVSAGKMPHATAAELSKLSTRDGESTEWLDTPSWYLSKNEFSIIDSRYPQMIDGLPVTSYREDMFRLPVGLPDHMPLPVMINGYPVPQSYSGVEGSWPLLSQPSPHFWQPLLAGAQPGVVLSVGNLTRVFVIASMVPTPTRLISLDISAANARTNRAHLQVIEYILTEVSYAKSAFAQRLLYKLALAGGWASKEQLDELEVHAKTSGERSTPFQARFHELAISGIKPPDALARLLKGMHCLPYFFSDGSLRAQENPFSPQEGRPFSYYYEHDDQWEKIAQCVREHRIHIIEADLAGIGTFPALAKALQNNSESKDKHLGENVSVIDISNVIDFLDTLQLKHQLAKNLRELPTNSRTIAIFSTFDPVEPDSNKGCAQDEFYKYCGCTYQQFHFLFSHSSIFQINAKPLTNPLRTLPQRVLTLPDSFYSMPSLNPSNSLVRSMELQVPRALDKGQRHLSDEQSWMSKRPKSLEQIIGGEPALKAFVRRAS